MKTKTIQELASLKGRKAVVAGGAGHIGGMIRETLKELGAEVAVLDREAAVKGTPPLGTRGGRGELFYPCDLRNEKETRRVSQRMIADLEGLDILVHAAAYVGDTPVAGWKAPFADQTVEAWNEALQVNLTSMFVLVQESREALLASGRGSVLLFSSIYGMVGPDWRLYLATDMANPAAYNVSKGGVLQLTRYLATLLAPKVRVNAISPGGVARGQPPSFQDRYCQRTPLGRMAAEEDMKGAVAYLATDLSRYVTGQNLVVDGGYTIW